MLLQGTTHKKVKLLPILSTEPRLDSYFLFRLPHDIILQVFAQDSQIISGLAGERKRLGEGHRVSVPSQAGSSLCASERQQHPLKFAVIAVFPLCLSSSSDTYRRCCSKWAIKNTPDGQRDPAGTLRVSS